MKIFKKAKIVEETIVEEENKGPTLVYGDLQEADAVYTYEDRPEVVETTSSVEYAYSEEVAAVEETQGVEYAYENSSAHPNEMVIYDNHATR